MTTSHPFKFLLVAALVFVAGCGSDGNGSPTSPSSSTPTRIISIEGSLSFGDVAIGQSREITVTVRNSGNSAMTMTGITGGGGVTTQTAASPTTGTIQPGAGLAVLFRFTPTTAGPVSGTVTFTVDSTSGTNTAPLSGNGVAPPVTVVGVVTDANTRRPVGGARVAALTSNAALTLLAETTTDGNGFYSFVVPGGVAISFNVSREGYNVQSSAATLTSDTRRDVTLNPLWTASGIGNTVFDMPTFVSRVRITGTYRASGSNFIVWVGNRLVVNEIIGTARQGGPTYTGIHAVSGGQVRIENSRDVEWIFTQVQ